MDNRHHTVLRVLWVGSRSQWPRKHVARVRGTNVCQINRSWKQYENYCIDMAYLAFIRGLSERYPAILNISRTGSVTLMYLGSQSEETLLRFRQQSLSRGASQSAVRRRWLSLCTVWPSHSPISSLSTAILALGKAISRREPNLGCRGAGRPGWCDVLPKKSLQVTCRMDANSCCYLLQQVAAAVWHIPLLYTRFELLMMDGKTDRNM